MVGLFRNGYCPLVKKTTLLLLLSSFSWGLDWTERLKIPPSAARVTESFSPAHTSAEWPDFILVQDVHRHPSIQTNIAQIIQLGYEQWGVRKVFLEGAFKTLDFSLFHRVPDSARQALLEKLVQEGDLSGPEVAAINIMELEWSNPPVSPFQLFGLEDPRLYRKNLAAYQSVEDRRPQALQELLATRRLQDMLKLPIPNPLGTQLNRIERLLQLKITPAEFAEYRKAKGLLPDPSPALLEGLRAAENFYALADARSELFIKQVQKKAPAGVGPRLAVVGGFHTPLMASRLQSLGYSYVIIAPTTNATTRDTLYRQRLREDISLLSEAIDPKRR